MFTDFLQCFIYVINVRKTNNCVTIGTKLSFWLIKNDKVMKSFIDSVYYSGI